MQNEKSLDGLRGVAAFIVVIHNYLLGFYPSTYSGNMDTIRTNSGIDATLASTPINILYNGNVSVCIFFVLSGYVLSYKFFKYSDKNIITSSAIRRYLRLMIPVLFSIIVAYVFMKFKLFYNSDVAIITGSDWWLANFYNFTPNIFEMLKQGAYGVFFLNESSYNAVLWTMHYELFGSFVVFGIISIFGNIRNRSIIYIVCILLTYNTYYLAFILGIILSDANSNCDKFINSFNSKYLKIFLLVIGLILCSYPSGIDVKETIYEYMRIPKIDDIVAFYHILGSFLIIIILLKSDILKRFFALKIPLFFGKISFSMYIIHLIILCSFSSFLFSKIINNFRYYQAFIIMLMISLIIIILISYYIYKYVDCIAIKLSKKIYKKYFS
ncbi:acyltransferase family protein [Clostridium neonatale]|uniref:acyltransferase family protein n=1 Tax=Clostridium neonatale TaxID=137838 RepID=UPI001D93BF02|nr:acyltransferase [Clostridium neonatale]CAG9719557.1 Acyltransferase 3 [Clostridium neonatale]